MMKVVDFFCGAGGFSEGFRQAGFEIVQGVEINKNALDSFNFNFGTRNLPTNILEISQSVKTINEYVSKTEVIIGSPPCVSFSSSNKSGNADKSLGIELIKAFLKIVTVKKYQKNSILKAYFMENVTNSMDYLKYKNGFTFEELDLGEWCQQIPNPETKSGYFTPGDKAIIPYADTRILNSKNYGSYQARKRAITAHIINVGAMESPPMCESNKKSLRHFFNAFISPFPNLDKSKVINDPNYPILRLNKIELTDHFYDTRIHNMDAMLSKLLKINHPYMGKMSFPENIDKSVRTITATKISMAREAIIFDSELQSTDANYRLPTVREAACFMGFPITYQFKGSESIKWKQIGNAVCPTLSFALAKQLKKVVLNTDVKRQVVTNFTKPEFEYYSLENFMPKTIVPTKKSNKSRFRGHYLKKLNITITLANYSIRDGNKAKRYWNCSVQKGTGKDSFHYEFKKSKYQQTLDAINLFLGKEEKLILTRLENQLRILDLSRGTVEDAFINRRDSLLEPNRLTEFITKEINTPNSKEEGERIPNYWSQVPINNILHEKIKRNFNLEGDQLIALAIFISLSKALSK